MRVIKFKVVTQSRFNVLEVLRGCVGHLSGGWTCRRCGGGGLTTINNKLVCSNCREPVMRRRVKMAETMTGTQVFEAVAEKTELKKNQVRAVVYAISELAAATLKKTGTFRIPHVGKFAVKKYPAKKYPAGNYPNMFKKDAEGKPVMEYKEARVKPARTKVKFSVASQIKEPFGAKK
jgi:nucleoid DNA-binding protein